MGISIYKRRELAIKEAKKYFPAEVSVYDAYDIAQKSIDSYIGILNNRTCKGIDGEDCDNIISNHNKTGLCRSCYTRKYRRKDQQKRLDALRQRYYRKKKKGVSDL